MVPGGLFGIKWHSLYWSSYFQKWPFLFPFSFPLRTWQNLIYWWLQSLGKFLNMSRSEFPCPYDGDDSLCLTWCGNRNENPMQSVQPGPQLVRRWPFPTQLSYHRDTGSVLDTGDFQCLGSWQSHLDKVMWIDGKRSHISHDASYWVCDSLWNTSETPLYPLCVS